MKRTCPKCGRTFNLLDPADAAEVHYGHECEVRREPTEVRREPTEDERFAAFIKADGGVFPSGDARND